MDDEAAFMSGWAKATAPATALPLAAPLVDDEAAIPERRWVGGHGGFPRPKLAVIAGPPGVSKTTLALEMAMCLACGVPFGDMLRPEAPCRVMLAVIEDEIDEIRRRAHAAAAMFADAPHLRRLVNQNLAIVDVSDCVPFFVVHPDGTIIETPGFAAYEATIAQFAPDIAFLDPLVELHTAEENSNTLMRPVLKRLRGLSAAADCVHCLIHHEAKGGDGSPLQRLRGAGAIGGAIRNLISLRPMTPDEAKEHSIAEDMADLYVRIETGKQQYARKSKPRWLVIEERELANGDRAHLLAPWNAPSMTITPEMEGAAMAALRRGVGGEPCTESPRSAAFFRNALDAADIPRSAHSEILRRLKEAGTVVAMGWHDPTDRKTRKRLWVRNNQFEGWKDDPAE
jgi:hypothetical protein